MEELMRKYELFLFDLDGTLYEDTDHFDYYAKLLKADLSADEQQAFDKEYQAMKEGKHIVSIGRAYDVERDAILTLDPLTLNVVAVHDWDGQAWEEAKVKATYAGNLAFDFDTMIAIGDGWWLPFVAAKHFGVEDTYGCYLKTKEFMVTDQFQLTKTPGLKEGLKRLKEEKQIVLVTNSDQEDVGRLLNELELDGIFDDIVPSAKKPANTKQHFTALLEKYDTAPEKAVSLGDNFINEIAPALEMGMGAVFIQPQDTDVEHERVRVVKSLAELF